MLKGGSLMSVQVYLPQSQPRQEDRPCQVPVGETSPSSIYATVNGDRTSSRRTYLGSA